MPTLVSLDGRLVPPEQALVPVLDRGFLYGDSVYEVVRTYRGTLFEPGKHLARLQRSAALIGLALPPLPDIEAEARRTMAAAGNPESYVRIIVTRGQGTFGLSPHLSDERRLVVIVRPLELPPPELYERGLRLAIVGIRRNPPRALDPSAKTGNYLNSVLALGQAKKMGADDAILLDLVGRVTELSTSNVFFVKGGIVVTPALALGLLDGVTRGIVMELARGQGLYVQEAFHGPEALAAADEVFVTSTIREVMPCTQIVFAGEPEPRLVGGGAPGPVAKALRAAFAGYVEKRLGGA